MKKTSTSKADVILLENNHIKIQVHDETVVEKKDIAEINKAKLKLVGNNRHTLIFVPGIFSTISAEARKFCASAEITHNVIAQAIIVRNFSNRLIGNFFIKVNNPPVPTSLFTSEIAAAKWLNRISIKTLEEN